MSQIAVLKKAASELLINYQQKIIEFGIDEFLKTGVDPFRFSFNISVWGIKKTIRKEIEHKLEMKLENLIGDFHENYLGNVTHAPSKTRWEKVPKGDLEGIDIKNSKRNIYLQIKSKHNSMNSSSSKELYNQLESLKNTMPDATVGCGWVIAFKSKKCAGEALISKIGITLKAKELFKYVTGEPDEMCNVLGDFAQIIDEESKNIDFDSILDKSASKIAKDLQDRASHEGVDIVDYLFNMAIGEI